MKLLFDLSATQTSATVKNHGGAEYSIRVYKKLLEYLDVSLSIEAVYKPSMNMPEEVTRLNIENNILLREFESIETLEKIIIDGKYDKFYSGLGYDYQDLKLPEFCKLIVTIHGLRFLELIDDEYKKYYVKNIRKYEIRAFRDRLTKKNERRYAKNFNKYNKLLTKLKSHGEIVVVSNHTKNSILSYFDTIDSNDIKVFYSPEKISFKYEKKIEKKNYFLILSANRWEKNAVRALLAFDDFFNREDTKNYTALVLGNAPHSIRAELKNISNFEFKEYVSSEELEKLYAEAYALFYPSLNEGFGYPPLEAMKYGTPVLTSAITSIPEVCGDAVLYFNPYSIKEMKARLMEVLYLNYDDLKSKSLKRYEFIKKKQEQDLESLSKFLIE